MTNKKIGILGGGQLGKMINTAASPWHLKMSYLDKTKDSPVAQFTNSFVEGDYNDYDDVLNFGKQEDILGVEIEHVNTKALKTCQALGKLIFPDPTLLEIIKNKKEQYLFFQGYGFPVPSFQYYTDTELIKTDIQKGAINFPFVQKATDLGYDGKGVAILNSVKDLPKLLPRDTIIQNKIEIKKEISVLIARNTQGDIKTYEPVEMVFDSNANLLDVLICPAQLTETIRQQSIELAREIAIKMEITGLLAVELFLDQKNQLWVNEVAPRPHNSGHHTIEASLTSQYQQYLRCLLSMPLGSTTMTSPCAIMVNLLGQPGHQGKAIYEGIEKYLHDPKVFIHLYGKNETRPNRKMGHVTILCDSVAEGIEKSTHIKHQIRITSK